MTWARPSGRNGARPHTFPWFGGVVQDCYRRRVFTAMASLPVVPPKSASPPKFARIAPSQSGGKGRERLSK